MTTTETALSVEPSTEQRTWQTWLRSGLRWESGLVVLFVVSLIYGSSVSSYFLNMQTFFFAGLNFGEIAIMALPMTLIIITGEIDLSVGSMLGLSASILGYLFMHGWNIWWAMAICLAVGIIGGALNGLLITTLGLPSIAVTIGTLTLYRGIALIVLGSNTAVGFPASFTKISLPIGNTHIAYDFAIFVVLALIFGVVLHMTPVGRSIYAIGLQGETAFFSGIRVKRIKFFLYVVSGFLCAFAGLLYTFQQASSASDTGLGLELNVVAIALFGGVSIFGGRGTIVGVVLSVAIFASLQSSLTDV
ncbi:MAG: ABC transporter permease, partial [Acidobacteria bacterium]|nr:ABC transporter permease [Acidobacteriota bacterium]